MIRRGISHQPAFRGNLLPVRKCCVKTVIAIRLPTPSHQSVISEAFIYRLLGPASHRVAIANSRIVSLDDGRVGFTWKNYRCAGQTKVMTLEAHEFIRRFLLGFSQLPNLPILRQQTSTINLVRKSRGWLY